MDEEIISEEETDETDEKQDKSVSSDLIRGHINTIILRALYDGDKYGYEIIAEIERKSHGQYALKQPSLYSALKRLEKDGYITSYWGGSVGGGRRKYFSLTDAGKEIAEQNQAEWEYSRTIIDSLISDRDFDFNNPAPSAVNMRVLRRSTSRVPASEGEEGEEVFAPAFEDIAQQERLAAEYEKKASELEEEKAALAARREEFEREMAAREEAIKQEQTAGEELLAAKRTAIDEEVEAQRRAFEEERAHLDALRRQQEEQASVQISRESELISEQTRLREEAKRSSAALEEERARHARILEEERAQHARAMQEQDLRIRSELEEEFRRREKELLHQNYRNLIDSPPAPEQQPGEFAYRTSSQPSEPTQGDGQYRTVLDRMYAGAIPRRGEQEKGTERAQSLDGIDLSDLEARAKQDGIRITTAGGQSTLKKETERENLIHKGKALFLSALVVFFFCVALGGVVMGLQKRFALPLFYPYFIWGVGVALLLVTGLAYANHYGERALRRTGPVIINVVVIYALLVIVTLIVALAVKIDFASVNALMTYIVFPVVFFLGVVIFGVVYYVQVHLIKKK